MRYCKHMEWHEYLDGDFYCCGIGMCSSSDWCEPGDEEVSECQKYEEAST
jgi:hypothetical protein